MSLQADDWGVKRLDKNEALAWADVERIEIMTTDKGPWREDFFWRIENAEGEGLAIGGDDAEVVRLVDLVLKRYPDLDYDAYTRALRSTENARFLVWRRRKY